MRTLFTVILVIFLTLPNVGTANESKTTPHIALLSMDMMILPGTGEYLSSSIERAYRSGAQLVVVSFNTPGGMLDTSQEMIQALFQSPLPVVIYVSPTGSSATSAGVFITMASHIAVMAPGTSIGAAHPVQGDGKDIEGDMRKKAENMAIAMVKSITDIRGRNAEWAERSVRESSSVTEKEALKLGVVDFVATDLDDLLHQLKGRKIKLGPGELTLGDYSALPRISYEISLKDKLINVLANPTVIALLWLAATTGLTIELYSPGAILPGVVGVICLVAALSLSRIIPINEGGVLLLIVGGALLVAELFVPSGILGIGGVISIVLGSLYLVDLNEAPGLSVSSGLVITAGAFAGATILFISYKVRKTLKSKITTGSEGLIGQEGRALENFTTRGKVMVNGEVWSATAEEGVVERGAPVVVVSINDGLLLKVKAK